ncbi:Uncharacterized protein YwqG [Amphritea atlantica]|uniref:Uncharacterized protein YwqG n=1 Tax=Amphritea atlantica TaxID=355243 RepID=A0A1H9IFD4_9GAMM|nr:DUF1963 domain-containing protein [Amphritea atlantica]SEQ73289.1 Uncharacterized protein YwqG [Amphritea atlantica]
MSKEKLDSLLKPLVKKAIKLEPRANDAALAASCHTKFGGSPYAEAGDTWPSCPTCKKELTFINQIHDEIEQQLFVFYYCNECFPWGLGDEEKGQWLVRLYDEPSSSKIVNIARASNDEFAPTPCKVITSPVEVLPDWEGLDSASDELSDLCCKINDDSPWEEYEEAVERAGCLNDYATLLGGYPRFVQGEAGPVCPECNSQMIFYAQIDSENEANIMWGDVGLVYFFRCPEHKNQFQLELQCH